jgi:transcription elongation GreA/GreB family factor
MEHQGLVDATTGLSNQANEFKKRLEECEIEIERLTKELDELKNKIANNQESDNKCSADDFYVGQKVVTSTTARPKWMAGLKASIYKVNRKKCIIVASVEDNPHIADKVRFGNTVKINFPHHMLTPIKGE